MIAKSREYAIKNINEMILPCFEFSLRFKK